MFYQREGKSPVLLGPREGEEEEEKERSLLLSFLLS